MDQPPVPPQQPANQPPSSQQPTLPAQQQYPQPYPPQPIPQQPSAYPPQASYPQPPYPQQQPGYPPLPPYPPQPAQYPQMAYPPQPPIYPPQPQLPLPPYVGQPPLPPGYQQPYMMQPPQAPPPPGQPAPPAGQPLAAKKVSTTPSAFRNLFRVATLTSILSTIAFVVYIFTPRATAAQQSHAHPYYLAGLIGLAIAEACQLLAILVLIGHWASHFNTEKRFREIFVLLISLIPFMVVIIFLWTLIVYLRARRQNPASDETEQHKQELKEQAVNTLIDAGTNRSSAMAGSQTPALPAAGRPTLRDTVRRVIGPSTERSFSEVGNGLVTFTMIAVVLATIATLGAITPVKNLAAHQALTAPSGGKTSLTSTTSTGGGNPGDFKRFSVPSSTNNPSGVAAGPDGNLWMTRSCTPQTQGADCTGSDIVRVTPSGGVTVFPLTSTGEAEAITAGPDGNLWFGVTRELSVGSVARLTPNGTITEFPLITRGAASSITVGPDGALWFTQRRENEIARITTNGQASYFKLPYSITTPHGITAGPDGNLWFTAYYNLGGGVIGRLTPSGQFSVFNIPHVGDSYEIAKGADGLLWFTDGNAIGSITPGGQFTIYALPDASNQANSITTGPDGNAWFAACTPTNPTLNADPSSDVDGSCTNSIVGRIASGGQMTTYPLTSGTIAVELTVGPDKNLWCIEPYSDVMGRITS